VTWRIGAFALATLALVLDLALVRPTRAALDVGQAQYEAVRSERAALRARLLELERTQGRKSRPKAVEVVPLREGIVGCLSHRSVHNVRIALAPQAGRTSVSLSGTGSLREELELLSDLLGGGVGLLPRRIRFIPAPPDVAFALEAEAP
jgi:hypothetical protein